MPSLGEATERLNSGHSAPARALARCSTSGWSAAICARLRVELAIPHLLLIGTSARMAAQRCGLEGRVRLAPPAAVLEGSARREALSAQLPIDLQAARAMYFAQPVFARRRLR
jgi:hypothetical protein